MLFRSLNLKLKTHFYTKYCIVTVITKLHILNGNFDENKRRHNFLNLHVNTGLLMQSTVLMK